MIPDPLSVLQSIDRIEGNSVLLRRFTEDDASAVLAYGSDPETTRHLIWAGCKTTEEALVAVRNVLIPHPGVFAITLRNNGHDNSLCIGCIDIRPDYPNEKAGFGYVLNRAYWGRGITTEALSLVLEIAFVRLELNRVESHHFVDNPGSGKVMTHCGLVKEGFFPQQFKVKGEFKDTVHYGLLRSQWQKGSF